jgi:RNA polymerase sigma-70 factor (sigma-E family)
MSISTQSALTPVRQIEVLHSRHYVSLVRLAVALIDRKDIAEEIVQEAFLQLFNNWSRLRDASQADAYLRRAVVNRSRDELRSRRVRRKATRIAPPDDPSSEDQFILREDERRLLEALKKLPLRQREVLTLRYFADLSERETAEVIGKSVGTVKSAAHRGIAALRSALGDDSYSKEGS